MDASLHQVPDEVIEKLQTVAFDLVVYFGLFLEFITFGLQTRIIEGFQLEPVLLKHWEEGLELIVGHCAFGVKQVQVFSNAVDEMGQV